MRFSAENKSILTIPETSEQFGFPLSALRNLVKKNQLPVVRVGNRVYITRDAMKEYLKNGGMLSSREAEVKPGHTLKTGGKVVSR